ncbi:MAG: FHA domain-containing protein [Candidatus Aminicenantes bacterium]|nr:MAG: FHA domain-containing protein [Candidatus Aminicenantes bacterium]
MVTLVIEGSGGSQLTYQLEKQAISVGASSRNDIVLRAPGVAPQHVVIQRNGEVFTFLGQQRQVVVLNGERRSRGVLRVGDKIRIGTATIIFKGSDEGETAVEVVDGAKDPAGERSPTPRPIAENGKQRSEIVLYRESHHLSDARQQLVEIFRSRTRSDLAPSLRTFFAKVFGERQALLALIDAEGEFQPVISQWEGDLPKLPARSFESSLQWGDTRFCGWPVSFSWSTRLIAARHGPTPSCLSSPLPKTKTRTVSYSANSPGCWR